MLTKRFRIFTKTCKACKGSPKIIMQSVTTAYLQRCSGKCYQVPILKCRMAEGFISQSDTMVNVPLSANGSHFVTLRSTGWIIGKNLSCLNLLSSSFILKPLQWTAQLHFCPIRPHKPLESSDTRAAHAAMVPFGLFADSVPFLAGKSEVPVPRARRIQLLSHLSCNI